MARPTDKAVSRGPVSFDVSVARLPKNGMPLTMEADEKQRAALAREHDLLEVTQFRAELLVSGWKRNGVKIAGRVKAEIVQACVVTLDPLPAVIDEAFSAVYLPEDSKLAREGFGAGGEILIDVEGPDSPETFSGDRIDVGALTEEHFALAIDPYPRKQGARLPAPDSVSERAHDESPVRMLGSRFPKD